MQPTHSNTSASHHGTPPKIHLDVCKQTTIVPKLQNAKLTLDQINNLLKTKKHLRLPHSHEIAIHDGNHHVRRCHGNHPLIREMDKFAEQAQVTILQRSDDPNHRKMEPTDIEWFQHKHMLTDLLRTPNAPYQQYHPTQPNQFLGFVTVQVQTWFMHQTNKIRAINYLASNFNGCITHP